MNKRIKLTIGIGLAVLLLAAVFATEAFSQEPGGAFGMMGNGQGMMGDGQGIVGSASPISSTMPVGCPMFGAVANPANGQPLTFDKAVEAAKQYLQSYNSADLKLAEVMEFENSFYAVVTERSTGADAFELLVNRYTGVVHPEPGPTMMWNTKPWTFSRTARPMGC